MVAVIVVTVRSTFEEVHWTMANNCHSWSLVTIFVGKTVRFLKRESKKTAAEQILKMMFSNTKHLKTVPVQWWP